MTKQVHKNAGRSDIVNWISGRINVKVEGLQDLGTGHVYCLLINDYYPKTIGETLINTSPHNYHEYVHNLKLFQIALNKLRCGRRIQIDKLSKMKFQENWETISWLKRFLEEDKSQKSRMKENRLTPKKLQQKTQQVFRDPLSVIASMGNSGKETPLGKASITSTLIQNNYIALIDRMKEVVSSGQSQNQKLRLLQMLLNLSSKEPKDRSDNAESEKEKWSKQNKVQKERELDFNIQELGQQQ